MARWEKLLVFFVAIVFCLTVTGIVFAQEGEGEGEGEKEEKTTMSVFDLILAGGWIGGFIILLCIVALGLTIECFVTIRRDKMIPPELLGELEVLFDEEEYEEAMELCEVEPCFLTNVIGAALPKISDGYEEMKNTMTEIGEEESVKYSQHIGYLSLIANVSPMLGLLGTVMGMIRAFSEIAKSQGAASPAVLAKGIYEALMTTCMGLIVAIIFTCVYFVIRNRLTRIIIEIGVIVEELMDRFKAPVQ